MLTQIQLKQHLYYSPETGVFTRLIANSSSVKIGDIAGYLDNGYLRIKVLGVKYLAHRLAWLYVYGEFPPQDIDHISHKRDDNRIINLRAVTRRENLRNASMSKANTSGVTGVYWCKRHQKWIARIMVDDRLINLGSFVDKFEAICARKSAENKYGYHENHGR